MFNADTDEPVGLLDVLLNEDGVYCIPSHEVNFQARPTPECPTTLSADMTLVGPIHEERLENSGPYTIFGDLDGDFKGRTLKPGNYTIDSDIFSEQDLRGDLVVGRIFDFYADHCIVEPPVNKFSATPLNGDEEVPPVHTAVLGESSFVVDDEVAHITFSVTVDDNGEEAGLLGAAGAHIHCGNAGENGPVVAFLAGAIGAGLKGTVVLGGTLSNANVIPTDCGSTIEEVVQSMIAQATYVNIHSIANPTGEVRGQIIPDH